MDVSKFKTTAISKMNNMFKNCIAVNTLNMMDFDTSNVDVTDMLLGCSGLTLIRTPKKMEEGQTIALSKTFYDVDMVSWQHTPVKRWLPFCTIMPDTRICPLPRPGISTVIQMQTGLAAGQWSV